MPSANQVRARPAPESKTTCAPKASEQEGPALPREGLVTGEDEDEGRAERVGAVGDARQCRRIMNTAPEEFGAQVGHEQPATTSGTSGVGSKNSIGTNTSCVGRVQALPTGNGDPRGREVASTVAASAAARERARPGRQRCERDRDGEERRGGGCLCRDERAALTLGVRSRPAISRLSASGVS